MKKVLHVFFLICLGLQGFGQIIRINHSAFPESSYGPEQLIEDILISGGCTSVDNFSFQVNGAPTDRYIKSYGYFKKHVGNNFPFEEGIILTTGRAYLGGNITSDILDGPPFPSFDNKQGGDSDLEKALGQTNTYDATFIKFNFVPLTDEISFRFLMASEEYDGAFECDFSDSFAFLLREVGEVNYTNLAVLPDGTPVSVTNINNSSSVFNNSCVDCLGCEDCDIDNCNCDNNINYFEAYYTGDTNYGGRTVVLTASSIVVPNKVYEIKLVVADQGNALMDSAIFFEAGSFNIGVNLGQDRIVAKGNPAGCDGDSITLDATLTLPGTTYKWFRNDMELVGETNSTLNVTINGKYQVETNLQEECNTDEIIIEFVPPPIISSIPEHILKCETDNDQREIFDLTIREADVLGIQDPDQFTITYHLSEAAALADIDAIPDPTMFINTANPLVIYVRIDNNDHNDCFDVSSFKISVNLYPEFELAEEYILCVDTNGTEEIIVPPIIDTGLDIMNYGFVWYLNGNILPVETGSSLTVVQAGNYSVDVIDNTTGCMNTGNTVVNLSAPPIVTGAVISRPFVDANVIEVTATAPGAQEYEYSLDNGPWQETNIFNNVSPGAHVVYARDINGCGIGSGSLTILDYPLFFTPNGDGFNDTWQISGIADQPSAKIYIYDRYGKLLKQLSPTSIGWDGTFNGQPLPSNDYWFTIEYIEPNNGSLSQFKSHFTLKR